MTQLRLPTCPTELLLFDDDDHRRIASITVTQIIVYTPEREEEAQ